jgi:hypothetical protein
MIEKRFSIRHLSFFIEAEARYLVVVASNEN